MAKATSYVSEDKLLDELYAWIDTIPLTRAKKNISRDFADGVLVAEVVAHFLPRLVELHNYRVASSSTQKKVNWQTLNRRVFSKMGMRIGDEVIAQLVEAKPGVIEKVLWDIRTKIDYFVSASDLRLTKKPQPMPQDKPTTPPGAISDPPLTYRVATPAMASCTPRIHSDSSRPSSPAAEPIEMKSSPPSPPPTSNFTTGFVVPAHAHQTQGYIAPSMFDSTAQAQGLGTQQVTSLIVDKNENANFGGPPAQIIYRGHKMIPLQFLEDREKEIRALESSNRTLTLKIHRLETIVNVKDQRIEDLTHQLQNLRSMYEKVTDSTYPASL